MSNGLSKPEDPQNLNSSQFPSILCSNQRPPSKPNKKYSKQFQNSIWVQKKAQKHSDKRILWKKHCSSRKRKSFSLFSFKPFSFIFLLNPNSCFCKAFFFLHTYEIYFWRLELETMKKNKLKKCAKLFHKYAFCVLIKM